MAGELIVVALLVIAVQSGVRGGVVQLLHEAKDDLQQIEELLGNDDKTTPSSSDDHPAPAVSADSVLKFISGMLGFNL